MHTQEQIKETIKNLPELTDDTLVHYIKIISSKHTAADKKLYAPLMKALEKERKTRGTAKIISSKSIAPKLSESTADDYPDEVVVPIDEE